MALNRNERIKKALEFIQGRTQYLTGHPNAKTQVAFMLINEKQ